MEDLWNLKQPLHRSGSGGQQQQQVQLVFAAGQDVGTSPFLAPEPCVIERAAYRPETGAANVIGFGLAAQKQGARMDHNMLALLSAGSQHQQLDQLTSRPHFQLSGPQPTYASDIPPRLLRNARLVLPETLRPSDVEFRTNQERFTEIESHHQRQLHALAPNRLLNSSSVPTFAAAASSGPRVYTMSISDCPMSGDLVLSEAGRLEVICSCHATRMPVSKFIQHAGFQSAAPGSAVFLENGESLIQWRKAVFSYLGLKVPDDDVGWDWNDAVWEADAAKQRTASGEANGLGDLSGHTFQGKGCHWDMSPASVAQSPMTGYLSSSMVCSSSPVISNASRQLKVTDQAHIRAAKGLPATGAFSMGGPTSEFFDFINRRGQAYCSSSFQQQVAIRDKCVPDSARSDKDNLFSSFELRLGQPSQPAHTIARDLRSRNLPSGADFQTAYEKTAAEAGYQHVQGPGYAQHSFQGPSPPFSVQFPQSRLNLLRMEQQISVSGSALSENGKLLTEFAQSQKLSQHQGDVGLSGISCRTEISHAKQRPGNGRLLDDIVSTGQRSLSQAWMQRACNNFVEGQRCGDFLGAAAANQEQPRNYIGGECEGGSNLPGRGLLQTTDAVSQLPTGGASCPAFQASAGSNEPGSVVYGSTSGQELQPAATTKSLAADEPRESSVLLSPVETAANGILISDAQAARADPSGWMAADVRDSAIHTVPEEAHKSTSENTSLNKELQSDVCSRGSANALDVPDANQEESTLECEDKRNDAVDEGSGIGKCSSNDQPSAIKKTDSTVSRECLANRKRASVSETTDNEIASGTGKRKAMKWRRVNSTLDSKDKEVSGPLVAAAEVKDKRLTSSRTSSEVVTRRRNPIPPRAEMPELRSRSKGASEISSLRKLRIIERESPGSKPPDTTRRSSFTGMTKMLSLKSIMKLPIDPKPLPEEKQNNNVREAFRTEVRKRKLSELGNQRTAAAGRQPTSSAERPPPVFVPRGERSSRSGSRKSARVWLASKAQMLDVGASEVQSGHGNEELEQPEEGRTSTAVPRRKRNAGGPSQASESRSVRRRLADNVLPDSCFVCGTSTCEPSNELLCCCLCPVKVHQACYGVPKPPKGSWACRACKSNVSGIACVLCGYGGGAMTRAQKTRTVVKGLVKLWSCEQRSSRSKRSKPSECEALGSSSNGKNTIMAGVGDPTATQWVHMVCALWMPGTRCLNLQTMGIFDVSGVTVARTRLACSICRRQGGSCIQCHEDNCAVAFHAWCAHTKGLLQIETVDDPSGHVRFHGWCSLHARADASKRPRCRGRQQAF